MKKIKISASILMVMFFLGQAHSFVEKRHQWWEVRLQNLSAEKAQVQKNTALDRQVLGIIDNEMNRARDIITVFESEMRDDGSLTHEERVMTEADIASEAGKTVPLLFALHQLKGLVNEPGNSTATAAVREAVQERIKKMIQTAFAEESPELAERIMNVEISKDDWKNLSVEYFIGRMMASRKSEEEHAIADIIERVSHALKTKNNTANAREMRILTIKLTREYLAECGIHVRTNDSAALEASWTWKRIHSSLVRDFIVCKKIMALIDSPGRVTGKVSLERIMFYHKNPADLESLLFKGQHPQQLNNKFMQKSVNTKPGSSIIMEIPAPLRTINVLEDIDRLRKGTIYSLNGREDRKFFDDLGKSFGTVINRHGVSMKNRFFREEEKMRLLRKKEGKSLQVSNEREFLEAKMQFQAGLALLAEYGKKSLAFIALVSEGRSISSDSIVEQYRNRLQRNHEYIQFTAGLVMECSRLSSVEDPRVHKDFSTALSRLNILFNFIGTCLNLERNDQTHLTRRDISVIRELKNQFNGTINSLKGDIRNSYGQYGLGRLSAEGAGKKSRESLQEKIAQDEIDGLFRHVGECAELYEQFQYGEKALYDYASRFKAFLKEARTGATSQALEYSLKMNSLFTSVENFDSPRIARECATKKYLQKEAKAALARLITMLDFYKKNKVVFKDAPSHKEITALEARINSVPQVRIDSWTMNESNFQEIDKKAVKKLSLVLSRKKLTPDKGAHGEGKKQTGTRMTISIREPELSLTFPWGWEEETIGEADTYLGIIKSFHSGDVNSSVKLVKLPLEKGDMKNTAEVWIQKSGCSLVEKRWQMAGDVHYLWILAKDKNKNISETCAVSKDGYTVLIMGKTSRDQYMKFKTQFKKIIESLQMEVL